MSKLPFPLPAHGRNLRRMCRENGMGLGLISQDEETLEYRLIKLLPTVGCEADAGTPYSIEERTAGTSDSKASPFAYESGCYVAVWPVKDNGSNKMLEVESCLISPLDKETRLGGCAICDSAFASTIPVAASEVTSLRKGLFSAAQAFKPARSWEFAKAGVQLIERDDCSLVPLPKQLWCSMQEIHGVTSAQDDQVVAGGDGKCSSSFIPSTIYGNAAAIQI
ncbi:hypothetical protein MLD38_013311 [Melastoma candidum]|uniref:Uncharacterized protein n=1 Tax=Melastoma candidum TaxID=119954 RepID=A0ACB9R957_9MYRT|nr:hypothetical protein MLD38_013311 [Melastoma candidum]